MSFVWLHRHADCRCRVWALFLLCSRQPVDKQLNDKERATAALENPVLRDTVERLIKDDRAHE